MMDIKALIEKYWAAETTVEDEKALKAYFQSDNIASEHLAFKPLFDHFAKEQSITYGQPIAASEAKSTPVKKTKSFVLATWIRSAAAVILLSVGAFWLLNQYKETKVERATIVEVQNPEEALAYTKAALAMLSKNYNKGKKQMSKGMSQFDRVNIIK